MYRPPVVAFQSEMGAYKFNKVGTSGLKLEMFQEALIKRFKYFLSNPSP